MSGMIHIHHQPHLFRAHDDHILCLSSAREFASLPFWEGNRFVKAEHIEQIKESLKGDIQSLTKTLFRAIGIVEDDGNVQWYIFDGQHRAMVLQSYFQETSYTEKKEDGSTVLCEGDMVDDFQILIMWKLYDSKQTAKIHQDFLDCNRASPIEWTVDPKMMTNAYIDALLLKFQGPAPTKKVKRVAKSFFREGKTKKPYVSIEKLREEILQKYTGLGWSKSPEEFAEQAFSYNEYLLEKLSAKEGRTAIETSMLEMGFALASNDFRWV